MLIKALPMSYKEKLSNIMANKTLTQYTEIRAALLALFERESAWNILPSQSQSQSRDKGPEKALLGQDRGKGRDRRISNFTTPILSRTRAFTIAGTDSGGQRGRGLHSNT